MCVIPFYLFPYFHRGYRWNKCSLSMKMKTGRTRTSTTRNGERKRRKRKRVRLSFFGFFLAARAGGPVFHF